MSIVPHHKVMICWYGKFCCIVSLPHAERFMLQNLMFNAIGEGLYILLDFTHIAIVFNHIVFNALQGDGFAIDVQNAAPVHEQMMY